ncbi:L-methionine gamma-lyase [Tepidimonas alkaliphilus]|uniref:L-methionine gamma-lyase n=1 Tax=Tepidimonas alkaliphilus TaxID=2588942 RepID=A0A554W6N4_9BURK|nr:O-acetylhomoserine aminocarboxypropyltransferase [Tepidimonas alkaliphilus]TSE19243.1 L-methionine gamma-lyase [Tepidimonas alkaliphilus]
MPGYADPGLTTLALHAGAAPDPVTGACAVPIHPTTAFVFKSADHAASLLNLERAGHADGHLSNPTTAALEQRVAALEGGIAGLATASGPAALHLAIVTLMGAGGHIVASDAIGGSRRSLLQQALPRLGIETTFVPPGDLDAWRAAVRPHTRLFFAETLSQWGADALDIPAVADIAHAAGVPLLVDSTLTTPWLVQPLSLGADLVLHSAAELLSGHGAAMGGLLVDGGAFDWEAAHARDGRFAELTEPDASFDGQAYTEVATVGAWALRARHVGLRDFGACLSPHTAWLILQGIETLPLRMARHMANTERVVEFLAAHPRVARVRHPLMPDHPSHRLAQRLLPRGAGSVFSFELKGGRAQGRAFVEALKLFLHHAHVGHSRSGALHPASATHARLSDEALAAAGIGPGTIRLSVGLEDADDLIDDLKRAFKAAEKAA